MKRKSFLLFLQVVAAALLSVPALTSCSDDDSAGSASIYPLTLDTPSNLRIDTVERTIHWDAVSHAAYYTIARNLLELAPATVTTNSYKLEESEYDRWNTYSITAYPAADDEGFYRQSAAASYTFVCPVNKQLLDTPDASSFVYDYQGDNASGTEASIRFIWASVEHAVSYQCTATLSGVSDDVSVTSRVVSDTTVVFSLRRGARYLMSLTAYPADGSEEWIASPALSLYLTVPASVSDVAAEE